MSVDFEEVGCEDMGFVHLAEDRLWAPSDWLKSVQYLDWLSDCVSSSRTLLKDKVYIKSKIPYNVLPSPRIYQYTVFYASLISGSVAPCHDM
jgi:hypothetical protein